MKRTMGRMVMTHGVNDLIAENNAFSKHVWDSLMRYRHHDWGEMAEEDKQMNDEAMKTSEGRIFAAYEHKTHPEWKIWIITEADDSATTILFPSEY